MKKKILQKRLQELEQQKKELLINSIDRMLFVIVKHVDETSFYERNNNES